MGAKMNRIFDEAIRAYHRFENLKPFFIKVKELTGVESNYEKTDEIYVFNEFARYWNYAKLSYTNYDTEIM